MKIQKLTHLMVAAGLLASASTMGYAAQSGASDENIDTFVFSYSNEPRIIDPRYTYDSNTAMVLASIFETLVRTKPGTSEIVPGLAESWEMEDEGRSIRFQLRQGIEFHDGTPFDAKAVCYNFDRNFNFKGVQQSRSLSTYWQEIFGGFATQDTPGSPASSLYKSCDVVEEHVARLNLNQPNASIVPALSSVYMGLSSPTAMEKYGDGVELKGTSFLFTGTYGTEHPTGTGPFKFHSWNRGDKLVLTANEKYWDGSPKIQTLIFKPIADGPARRQALENGEIDGFDAVAPQDIEPLRSAGFNIIERPINNVGYIGFNQNKPPYDNILVRQAIAHALNREAVLKAHFPESAILPQQWILPPDLAGYPKDYQFFAYDPEKAKQLLEESGLTDRTLEFWYPSGVTRSYMPDPKAIMEAFKVDLERVGFKVQAKAVPWVPEYVAALQQGRAPMYVIGRVSTHAAESDQLNALFGSGRLASTPELMERMEQAKLEMDADKRAAMYRAIGGELADLAPGVPFSSVPSYLAFKPEFVGYVASPTGYSGTLGWIRRKK